MERFGKNFASRRGLVALALLAASLGANAADAVDVGEKVPDVNAIKEGLFPEEACKELEAAGFKCMGFKSVVRYSLPASSFKVGSAELPDTLRKQLDVFAEAMRGRKNTGRAVRIEGHADASGTPEVNLALSQKRADAVKAYLVEKGTDAGLLEAIGIGSASPKVASNPYAPENRRVEIGRQPAQP